MAQYDCAVPQTIHISPRTRLLLAACAAVVLLTPAVFAGAHAAVLYAVLLNRLVVLLPVVGVVLAVPMLLAHRRGQLSPMLLATLPVLAAGVFSFVAFVLGTFGLVGPWPPLVVTLLAAAAAGWFGGAPRTSSASPLDWLWLLPAAALGLALTAAAMPPGTMWGGEPNGYDVLSYHLQVPREWRAAGVVWPLGHNVFSAMPMAAELLFMAAGGGIGAQLLNVLVAAGCVARNSWPAGAERERERERVGGTPCVTC